MGPDTCFRLGTDTRSSRPQQIFCPNLLGRKPAGKGKELFHRGKSIICSRDRIKRQIRRSRERRICNRSREKEIKENV